MKNIDPVSPVGSPTQQVLFKTKTGKVWKTGQDVECLATELNITTGEAEALLTYGQDAGQILTLFGVKETWKKIRHATDRVAYMRGVIKNRAAKPTRPTPPPVPPGPLPLQLAAASSKPVSVIETNDNNRARRDRILTKALDEMGPGEIAKDKYTLMDFCRYLDVGAEDLRKVRAHLNDMRLRGLVCFVGHGVYAAGPEWQRVTTVPPVPQDTYEHEEV